MYIQSDYRRREEVSCICNLIIVGVRGAHVYA